VGVVRAEESGRARTIEGLASLISITVETSLLFEGNSKEVIHYSEVASFAEGFFDTLFTDKFSSRE
jgi:hypothetical protein